VGRARHERRKQEQIARRSAHREQSAPSKKSSMTRDFVGLMVAFIIGGVVAYPIARYQTRAKVQPSSQRISTVHAGLALGRVLEMSSAELADVDIAEMNLLCARGLPGSETVDIPKALKTIDYWTDRIDLETRRNRHRFEEHPEEYENSEIYYSMSSLFSSRTWAFVTTRLLPIRIT
jgi:hypothetical protein